MNKIIEKLNEIYNLNENYIEVYRNRLNNIRENKLSFKIKTILAWSFSAFAILMSVINLSTNDIANLITKELIPIMHVGASFSFGTLATFVLKKNSPTFKKESDIIEEEIKCEIELEEHLAKRTILDKSMEILNNNININEFTNTVSEDNDKLNKEHEKLHNSVISKILMRKNKEVKSFYKKSIFAGYGSFVLAFLFFNIYNNILGVSNLLFEVLPAGVISLGTLRYFYKLEKDTLKATEKIKNEYNDILEEPINEYKIANLEVSLAKNKVLLEEQDKTNIQDLSNNPNYSKEDNLDKDLSLSRRKLR